MASVNESSEFDTVKILSQLTLEEKVALVSGTDFWHTASIKRLGIPAIRVSDGPNGVRGTKFFNGAPAACFPCGTAIGATWNVDLVQQAGSIQAQEAIAKGASTILGPTINIQRSPIGGRGFESYSEDPVLSGKLAAAIIKGIQGQGVSATLKHFVCNDQEDHRQSADSVVTQRALREIYLKPFQIAQLESDPRCYMTAYNKVNGIHCSEDKSLLQGILRDEWAFKGMVMSDWLGTYSTSEAVKAGLDLEMPGPSITRGGLLTKAIGSGKLSLHDLDLCVGRVLSFVQHCMKLGIPESAPEKSIDTPETSAFLRSLSADGIVLLKNEGSLLPFKKNKRTAVIGPNAAIAAYCGGGSAALDAYYTISPLEGISSVCQETRYTIGAPGWKDLPLLSNMTKTKNGSKGLDMTIYLQPPEESKRDTIDYIHVKKSDIILIDYHHPKVEADLFYADIEGHLTPDVSGEYEFGVTVAGTAKLFVDGELVVDNMTKQTKGSSFFGTGTVEEIGVAKLEKGKTYEIKVIFGSDPTKKIDRAGAQGLGPGGVRLGVARKLNLKEEIANAEALARDADQVVICAGLNSDWESEGYDREHMGLPPGSDELIEAVSKANPNTVVVLQSGTPVSMPWTDKVSGIIQAWYGGNECGNAIADIIFGEVNPSGKLPLTFPRRLQDNPAFLNTRTQRNRVLYGEDIYVGYRYYEACEKDVLFPFGHGLSYTSFKLSALTLQEENDDLVISVQVKNTGHVDGAEVVQVYARQHSPSVSRAPKDLKGFTKVYLKAGEAESAEIRLRKKDVTSFWDEERNQWTQEKGKYSILVGNSSASTPLQEIFEVKETSWWSGL